MQTFSQSPRRNSSRIRVPNILFAVVLIFTLVAVSPPAPARAAGVVYRVTPTGLASGTCGWDWESNACSLQRAIALASSTDFIWVSDGTYLPGTLRTDTFSLKTGVTIYGGFEGDETSDTARDPAAHVTILSGNIGDQGLVSDNSYHVVTAAASTTNQVLDGFTITAGNANGSGTDGTGGGIYAAMLAAPTLSHLIIDGNRGDVGGGMYTTGAPALSHITFRYNFSTLDGAGLAVVGAGDLTLTDVTFHANNASGEGGGICSTTTGTLKLDRATFTSNVAENGGGVALYNGNLDLDRAVFRLNTADYDGGGLFTSIPPATIRTLTATDVSFDTNTATNGSGGGWRSVLASPTLNRVTFKFNTSNGYGGGYLSTGPASPVVTNSTFYGNSANYGGGMTNNDASRATLKNVTFSDNSADTLGGAMYNITTSWPTITASIFWLDGTEITSDSDSGGYYYDVISMAGCPGWHITCSNVTNIDPRLADLGYHGGFTETMPLLWGSPAIDYAGLNGACETIDQRGLSRPTGAGCDAGAYERIAPPFHSDFEHDHMSDPVKWVPSLGSVWWLQSSDGTWDGRVLGGDVTSYIPRSDFDGDGKTDPAKWVGGLNSIWYLRSSDGTWQGFYIGGDVASLLYGMDFDGDGKTDPAKFLASGWIWYIKSSTGTWDGVYLGSDGVPLWGCDFDGDGRTDPAKYIAAGAIWYLKSTTGTWDGVYVGTDGTPISGSDFDGDGETDAAKLLSSGDTIWYIASTSGEWNGIYLGPETYTYIAGHDFDGDGLTDPATFNASTGALWYRQSSDQTWQGLGLGTDAYQIAN